MTESSPSSTERGAGASRTRQRRERLRAVQSQAEERFDDVRHRIVAVDVVARAVERDGEIGGFVLAGALAFRLFVYALPMYLLVLIVGAGAFSYDPDTAQRLGDQAGLSRHVMVTLADATETSRRSLWILVPVTVWALLVAGRSVQRVTSLAHSRAWRRPPETAIEAITEEER